jgi:hypothetical protein
MSNMAASSKHTQGAAGSGRLLQGRQPRSGEERSGGGGSGGGDSGGGGGGSRGEREANATAAGIALSGMYIYNALDGNNADAVESELTTLDVCISHPSPFGQIHYHYWSPCVKAGMGYYSNSVAPELCKNEPDCLTKTDTVVRTGSSNS